MGYSAEAYARQLKRLLPPGRLWNLLPDSVLSKVFLAAGDELARVDTRGAEFIAETDPRTATETLPDWERMLGLPDEDILTIPVTDADRRVAITAKFTRVGGQAPTYFLALAEACGYTGPNTITEGYASTVFRVGYSAVGDPLRGVEWAHVWEMNVTVPGSGAFLTQTELEAVIRRAAPAHTVVIFNYV